MLALPAPSSVFACATCFAGNVDTPMTQGMNWGIVTLMGVIGTVLASFAVFFIYIMRKSAAMAAQAAAEKSFESNKV